MEKINSNSKVDIAAFIYARSDSVRLPRKVFLPLGNESIIEVVLRRAKACLVDKVVLLTSDRAIDDELVEKAIKLNYEIIRGDSKDLIARTLNAIEVIKPKQFVRINADSPLFEPRLLNFILEKNLNYDVITNLLNRTFPYGVAVEVINCNYYKAMAGLAMENEKEHVTQHIYRTINNAKLLQLEQLNNHSHIRLTIDEKEDYNNIDKLWKKMKNDLSSYWEVLGLAEPSFVFKT